MFYLRNANGWAGHGLTPNGNQMEPAQVLYTNTSMMKRGQIQSGDIAQKKKVPKRPQQVCEKYDIATHKKF